MKIKMATPYLLLLFVCLLAPNNLPSATAILTDDPFPIDNHLPIDKCAPINSMFHNCCKCSGRTGMDCGVDVKVEFTCSKLPQFFEEGYNNSAVNCLRIMDSPDLKTISTVGLQQFPNLTGLVVKGTRLNRVYNGALVQLTSLTYLELVSNMLTMVPNIAQLNSLRVIKLSDNLIEEVDTTTFSGVTHLTSLYLAHNRLSKLKGQMLPNNCFLRNLDFSNNPITEIDDEIFESSHVDTLNLANTRISRMPVHPHLTSQLRSLDLRGCRNLKTFHFLTGNNQTFPALENVEMPYHAHCCQLARINSQSNTSARTVRDVNEHQTTGDRRRRDAEEASSVGLSSSSSLMVQSLQTSIPGTDFTSTSISAVLEPTSTVAPVVTMTTVVNRIICFDDPPPSTCDPHVTPSTSFRLEVCVQATCSVQCVQMHIAATPTFTNGLTVANTIQPSVTITSEAIHPTATPTIQPSSLTPTLLATPVPSTDQASDTPTGLPNNSISTDLPTDPSTDPPTDPSTDPPTDPSTDPPTDSPTDPSISCDSSYCVTVIGAFSNCLSCISNACGGNCPTMFPDFCRICYHRTGRKRRKKRSTTLFGEEKLTGEASENHRRQRRNSFSLLDSPFAIYFPNYSDPFCCTPESRPVVLPIDVLTCATVVRESNIVDLEKLKCSPQEDPFNPCTDLLGASDGLRVAIWLVVILALLGNFLVIVVFLGYSVVVRKTDQDFFTVHFMYFNLALSDFLMGWYLFIIAVKDADTKGEFYLTDISWRTGHGCRFAGFLAMLSTVVSVYVLLVITVERTYTIVKVFNRVKLTKLSTSVIMGIGWVLGVFFAMLPLVGMSDYETVAICLPFNVQGPEDRTYVVFLLLVTGIAFIFIAVCYGIIFQQIFCNPRKISPAAENSRRATDVKVALRILILVFTNFICWFPIGLVSLTAVFGKSLVHNLEFARWAVVFIFPINACLNPFLYSLTTRTFKDRLLILLNKCGLCKKRARKIRAARAGLAPSFSSKTGSTSNTSGTTFVTKLRSFSLTSQSSTLSLLGRMNRKTSEASQLNGTGEIHRLNLLSHNGRRTSNVSSVSSEDFPNSRRGSAFSAGSNDNLLGTSHCNQGFLSSGSTELRSSLVAMAEGGQGRSRSKLSAGSLGALPEEVELPVEAIVEEGMIKVNPAYEDDEDNDQEDTERRDDGGESSVITIKEEEESSDAVVITNTNIIHVNTDQSKDKEKQQDSRSEDSQSSS